MRALELIWDLFFGRTVRRPGPHKGNPKGAGRGVVHQEVRSLNANCAHGQISNGRRTELSSAFAAICSSTFRQISHPEGPIP